MDRSDARGRLVAAGDAILARVDRALPAWLEGRADEITDAWGRLDADARTLVHRDVRDAAAAATARVCASLRDLFATDPADQRTTPLAIVRTAVTEVGAVLASAGIPAIERDPFEERAFPDDRYGLTPASFADLGDDALGPLQLEWGLAKARILRES